MNFDLRVVPFSRYGSYIAFSHLGESEDRKDGLYMRTVRGCGFHAGHLHVIFCLELLHGEQSISFTEIGSPSVLRLEADAGSVEICLAEPKLVRIKGSGVGLRLSSHTEMFANVIPARGQRWQMVSFSKQIKYMLAPLKGQLEVDAPWNVDKSDHIVADFLPDPDTGYSEAAIEDFVIVWQARDYPESFETCVDVVVQEFQSWQVKMPETPQTYAEAGELAAYIDWSCVVFPEGYVTRPAMYMSKNWMNGLWSWDNCFNAMALNLTNPELAWDQFMILADRQDASGAFPDSINDSICVWSFCKPPIHGWALKWMMERTNFIDKTRLAEVYEPLVRWTEWWFVYHDDDNDGLPQYNHGNDSGWDNSTVFRMLPPVESPDLAAYLIIQMEVLAQIALGLDKPAEASAWSDRASTLLELMLKHFWRDDHFIALRSGDHQVIAAESLLLSMPIILGKRLPDDVRARLIVGLKEEGRFLTEYGLATESLQSPFYESDGYWRGPIWAPSTMLIIDGLDAAGETMFAQELARRFCDMAARSGMAENYDALTGDGLRDRAFTWTASVFLILAHEYLTG